MPISAAQFGVCSWSLHPRSVDDLVAGLHRLELRRVQLALVPILEEPEQWRGLAPRLSGAGIEVVSGMFVGVRQDYTTLDSIRASGGIANAAAWPENFKLICKTTALAADLGIRRIGFHAGFIPADAEDPRYAAMLERVGAYGDVLAHHAMELVLETAEPSVATLSTFLTRLGRPNVGVNFDPGNMYMYGNTDEPVEALRRLGDGVRQVHLKDARRARSPGEWGVETPLGEGEVDWEDVFRQLAANAFDGPLLFERKVGPDPIRDLSMAKARIQALVRAMRPGDRTGEAQPGRG